MTGSFFKLASWGEGGRGSRRRPQPLMSTEISPYSFCALEHANKKIDFSLKSSENNFGWNIVWRPMAILLFSTVLTIQYNTVALDCTLHTIQCTPHCTNIWPKHSVQNLAAPLIYKETLEIHWCSADRYMEPSHLESQQRKTLSAVPFLLWNLIDFQECNTLSLGDNNKQPKSMKRSRTGWLPFH